MEYLIKSSACLALFLLFYALFLERERMHTLKRIYLLSAVVLALVIPFITITYQIDDTAIRVPEKQLVTFTSSTVEGNTIGGLLWLLYGMGVLVTAGKFAANLLGIIRKVRRNPKSREQGLIRVMVQESIIPHTFFNYIFLNIREFLAHRIPREIWLHEVTHARQKHSVDVVLLELLQVVFWFNPFIYFFKRKIKINHEFLADAGVLDHEVNPVHYQTTLLQYASNGNQPQLANAFTYSSIKKRIKIMKRNTSKNSIRLRALFVLPLIAGALYSFSNKVAVPRLSDAEVVISLVPAQEKATPEMVAEYNVLAKKYNEMSSPNFRVRGEEVERMKYIYSLMTATQKEQAEPFPELPDPPAAPRVLKGEISDLPPPPPPPAAPAEAIAEAAPVRTDAVAKISGQGSTDAVSAVDAVVAGSAAPAAAPAAVADPKIAGVPVPPEPGMPPTPEEHIRELAKAGATFYYEGSAISAKKARELVRSSESININVRNRNSKKPVVELSTHNQ